MKNVIGAILVGLGVTAVGAGLGAGAVALAILALVLKPLAAILGGWIIGHGVALVAGNFVAGALATILHAAITASTLPQIFAGLSLLSLYIRPAINRTGGVELKANKGDIKKSFDELKKDLRNSK
jgi:hypothetical protein